MSDTNARELTDEQLDDLLAGDDEESTTDEADPSEGAEGDDQGAVDADPPADGTDTESDTEQEDAEAADDAKPEGFNPDGPGDTKVALRQAREEAKAAKQRLAEYEAQQQAAVQRQQQAYEEAQFKQQLENAAYDPDETERLTADFRAKTLAQANQQVANDRVRLSEAYAVEAFPDYFEQIERLKAEFGQGIVQIAMQQENPALWAYQKAKKIPDPVTQQKAVEAEVAKQVAAALQKQQSPAKGPKSIGRVSSAGAMTTEDKPIQKMSDAELERAMGLR